ncbi:MAG: hypothetical protein Ta2A_26210 [Treponemataceae bacterium]|nr:MAG: hypothetical protein Ta2A_26210 [Treponemataceae bacterium]
MGSAAHTYTAIYDAAEALIFFDRQREEWIDNDARIRTDFPQAAFYRQCIVSSDSRTICLMPIVYLVIAPLKIEDNEIVE